jgi:hypothetical protein
MHYSVMQSSIGINPRHLANAMAAGCLSFSIATGSNGIETVVEQEAVGRLATVRLTRSSKLQAPVIDLLFASSGIEPEVVAEAERIELLPNLTTDRVTAPGSASGGAVVERRQLRTALRDVAQRAW